MANSPNDRNLTHSTVLSALEQVLEQRKHSDPNNSYVASLYHKGINKILEKVGEEATETIIAAKDYAIADQSTQIDSASTGPDDGTIEQALVGEVADLWFHSMVMLSHLDIPLNRVLETLDQRFGLSGLTEKSQRGNSTQ